MNALRIYNQGLTFSPHESWLIAAIVFIAGATLMSLLYRWPKTVAATFALILFIHYPLAIGITLIGSYFGDQGLKIGIGVLEILTLPGFMVSHVLMGIFDNPAINLINRTSNALIWAALSYGLLKGYGIFRTGKKAASNIG